MAIQTLKSLTPYELESLISRRLSGMTSAQLQSNLCATCSRRIRRRGKTCQKEGKGDSVESIQSDISFRPAAAQAMEHRWITMHLDPDQNLDTRRLSLLQTSRRSTTFQKFLAMQKLKKAALVVIASSLTHAEVGSLGDIFRRIDQSGDGVMTLTELDDAISRGRSCYVCAACIR
jgi:hypothetical protein